MTDSTPSGSSESTSTASVDTSSSAVSTSSPDTSSAPASTWDEAFAAQGLTGSSDPDSPTQAPPAPAPATVEPVAQVAEAAPAPSDQKGPIPFERHDAIVRNTREKTAREVVGQVQQHYGPAIDFQTRLQADPQGTLTQLITEAVADPNLGPMIKSHLARTLGQRKVNEEPQPDLDAGNGVLLYSHEQQQKREQWLRQQMAQEMNQRFAPIEQERQQREAQAAAERQTQQTRQTVTTRLGEFKKQPGFTENEPEIQSLQKQYVDSGMDPWSALGLAYAGVLNSKVLPKVRAESQSTLVAQAVAKANASTSNPASVAPSTLPRPKSWDEAFSQVGLGS